MPINKTSKKKDGKQQYRVRVNYTDSSGKAGQIERTAYRSAEAKLLELKLLDEVSKKTVPSTITVQKLYDEYIKAHALNVRETTLKITKQILNTNVLPSLKTVRLDKLDKSKLQEWKNAISQRDISITTKQNIYGEFRALLNYAVRMEYIPKNPLLILGNFRNVYFEMPEQKIQFYTPQEFKKYINAAKENAVTLTDWGYYVFFNIAFYT